MLETDFAPQPGVLTSLKDRWDSIGQLQKVGAIAVLCLVVATSVVLFASKGEESWKPLFTQLSPSRASQVVERLEEMGQPYRLGGEGTLVLVPAGAVNRLRLEFAGAGLMETETEGFELFEAASLSRSDFSERVTYLRALQGELSATITAIDNVRRARVHINLNDRPVFLDQKVEASAAVYVEMAPGTQLNDNQIRGIISLVSNSVEGMEPARVNLFDSTGALQISGSDLEEGTSSGGNAEEQSSHLTRVAQAMVDRILGPGSGIASVRVELEQTSRRVEKEIHLPGGQGGQGVPTHREDRTETFEGTKPAQAGEEGPQVAVVPGSAGEKPKYQQQAVTVDYAVSTTKEVTEEKPGTLARIHCSVIVDEGAGYTPEQLAALAQAVKVAIGLREERLDQFELQALPFNKDHLKQLDQEISEFEQKEADTQRLLMYALAGVGSTVLVGLILGLLMRGRKKRKKDWADMDISVDDMLSRKDPAALEEKVNLLLPSVMPDAQDESTDDLLLRALEEVERDPESVARLIESWMGREE